MSFRASQMVARVIVLASTAVGAVGVSVASAAEPPPSAPGSAGATVDDDGNTVLGSLEPANPVGGTDRYLVQLTAGTDLDRTVADVTAEGIDVAGTVEGAIDGFTATLDHNEVAELRRRDDVVRVERDELETVIDAQDDPPWGLDRIDERQLPSDTRYSPTNTGQGVTVYVFDSGINENHTDFAGRLPEGAYFDFGDGCPELADCLGHGTHVAGTIGGTTWGVAKNVSIVPVKVANRNGQSADSIVVAGINWAIDQHQSDQPAVANFSLGFDEAGSIDDAVKALIADGVTVVAAAGNKSDVSSCSHHPAAVPDVITVAAATSSDARASFSSPGSCNDLFAPGVAIESASNTSNDGSVLKSGTSMAAPHVTGAAALMLEQHPGFTPAQVWAAMDADTTKDAVTGLGTGDPNKLLHVTSADLLPAASELTAAVLPTDGVGSGEVRLSWAAPVVDGPEPVSDYVVEQSSDGSTWTIIDDGLSTATTFTVGGLTNGIAYWFRVAAVNAMGAGAESEPVTAKPAGPPALLTALSATGAPFDGVRSGEVKLAWNASPAREGVTGYVVEWTADGEAWTAVDDAASTATTATVSGLSNGTSYAFRVAAVNAFGAGPWRSTLGTPAWTPAAPTGLEAGTVPHGSGQVRLAWIAPIDNGGSDITDYVVERSVDGTSWTMVDDAVSTETTVTVSGLTNGTAYSFRVAAVNGVGAGLSSNPAVAVPQGPAAAPTGVTAEVAPAGGVSAGEVRLAWTAPSDTGGSAITGYEIAWSTNGVTWTTAEHGEPADPSFTVRGLRDGTTYQFRVAAVNAVGTGPWSAPIQAAPRWTPARPTALRATAGSRQVKLTWNTPATTHGSAVTDYVIQRSTNGSPWRMVRDGVSTARMRTVSRLTNGTHYRFRVAAKNGVGVGAWSVAVRATPRAR
jgi:subtilisin family serine protease